MSTRCEARGCAGPIHSGGLCDAHRKQRARRPDARLAPLRARTPAPPEAVPYVGLMLLPATVAAVDAAAARAAKSPRYVVARAVDGWAGRRAWSPGRGVVAGLALAACLNLFCVGASNGVLRADALAKSFPAKPAPGQMTPPCGRGQRAINGGCYIQAYDSETKVPLRCAKDDKEYFADEQGLCWDAKMAKPGVKVPSSVEP